MPIMKVHESNLKFHYFLCGGLNQKVCGQFKISKRDDVLCVRSSPFKNLNYKFDEVSGDMHVFKNTKSL